MLATSVDDHPELPARADDPAVKSRWGDSFCMIA